MELSRGVGRVTPIALLKDSWKEWTDIVERFARRSSSRHRVDPAAYEMLYQRILAICGEFSAGKDEAERLYYHELKDLVQPWLDVRVLEHADREILFDLYSRCLKVKQDFGIRDWRRLARQSVRMVAALAALVCVLAVWWAWRNGLLDPFLQRGEVWWVFLYRTARNYLGLPPWIILGAAATAVLIIIVQRMTRH